uniref:Angiopoietin-like 6 n=1 Tax=Salmo trutta TaxID=8032 RepID=A0A673Z355_SALTR
MKQCQYFVSVIYTPEDTAEARGVTDPLIGLCYLSGNRRGFVNDLPSGRWAEFGRSGLPLVPLHQACSIEHNYDYLNPGMFRNPNCLCESHTYTISVPQDPGGDCQHVLDSGETTNGIYLLRPQSANRLLQAWCEQTKSQGGWTVIQRRQDGSVNFFRTWEQYKQGFGNLDGEYWLGLEHLYWLTKQAHYNLESDWYRLRLGEYQGNAGDSMSWHNNKIVSHESFSLHFLIRELCPLPEGGWWYHMCAHSNLNGVWYRGGHYRSRYQDGVYWAEFHGGSYSLKTLFLIESHTRPNKEIHT